MKTACNKTASAILNFFYLMLSHPEAQAKAQEEMDRVIGRYRLPDFSDRDSLPYTNAILKEVLRYYPNVPLGLPHAGLEEGEYKGMRIPKGSLIIMNIW
jgi:cytochrome P450